MLTLAALPTFINQHLGWILFVLILVAGVAVGLRDMGRFSIKRVWAISGVCFDESIRRRVLWITPLAIVGVIIVSALQRPIDEQDAIRQTTKFALFATGLVVTITTIILACTNLPREIDNRVIYTVVTKPTTRLEIVVGKVMGFAKVSFTILVIMGIFSWGYLAIRSWNMQRDIANRLESENVPATSISTLKYYQSAGLLNAKSLEQADALQVFARVPEDNDPRIYFNGHGEGNFNVAFDINPDEFEAQGGDPSQTGLLVVAHVGYVRKGMTIEPPPATAPATQAAAATGPATRPYYGPYIMAPEERQRIMANLAPVATAPVVSIDVMDASMNPIATATALPPLKTLELLAPPNRLARVQAEIDAKAVKNLKGRIYIRVNGLSDNVEYFIDLSRPPAPVELLMPVAQPPAAPGQPPQMAFKPFEQVKDSKDSTRLMTPIFESRQGTFGQQLRGGIERSPTAVFEFRNAEVSFAHGKAPFELRSGIERSGDEVPTEEDRPTQVSVRVKNRTSGLLSEETIVHPESNRTVLFELPSQALEGGNFDVLVRCTTPSDYLGVKPESLSLITARQPFAWNLAKSLMIFWLMTILVTAVAIFTSTFLSWPIAVVLTLVILLGHWGVDQLGDAIQPGIGNQVVTDFGLKSPAKAEAVRATVEKLSSFLNFISTILPDISKFPAVEDIERGITIPAAKMRQAAAVTFGFGLPLVLLAYVFLKNKEVAP